MGLGSLGSEVCKAKELMLKFIVDIPRVGEADGTEDEGRGALVRVEGSLELENGDGGTEHDYLGLLVIGCSMQVD